VKENATHERTFWFIAEFKNRWYTRHLFQQRAPLSVQAPPPRRSMLFPSPKLLGHAPASFARGENGGECREATLSRLLLQIFMKYRTVLSLHTFSVVVSVRADETQRKRGFPRSPCCLIKRPIVETPPLTLDANATSDVQVSYFLVSQIIVSFT
jgi:hypothetical protein